MKVTEMYRNASKIRFEAVFYTGCFYLVRGYEIHKQSSHPTPLFIHILVSDVLVGLLSGDPLSVRSLVDISGSKSIREILRGI